MLYRFLWLRNTRFRYKIWISDTGFLHIVYGYVISVSLITEYKISVQNMDFRYEVRSYSLWLCYICFATTWWTNFSWIYLFYPWLLLKKKFTLSINPIKCHLFFCQFTKFLVHPIWTPCELMNYRQSVVKADVTYLFLPSHISLLGFYRYPELFLHPRRDQQPEWLDCLMFK